MILLLQKIHYKFKFIGLVISTIIKQHFDESILVPKNKKTYFFEILILTAGSCRFVSLMRTILKYVRMTPVKLQYVISLPKIKLYYNQDAYYPFI